MWPAHRQAVLTSGCVKPGPRPVLVCCPCVGPGMVCRPCPAPGRPLPGRLSTAAALYSELTCYLESMLRLAFQSSGESEDIRVQVSSVGVRREESSDGPGIQRGGNGATTARTDWGSSGGGPGLRSMWDGFSVDRYAPRVRSAAGPPQPQHREERDGDGCCLHGRSCRPPRRRPRTAPGGRQSTGRQRSPLPKGGSRGRGASPGPSSPPPPPPPPSPRGLVGHVSTATGLSAPGDDAARSTGLSAPGDDVAVARVTDSRPPSGGRRRRRRSPSPCPPAVTAYQRFVEQYRAALGWAAGGGLADGDPGLRQRRAAAAASDYEVKANKLMEQRHERIRNTILEKERKEQMEKRRLVNERLKRRVMERHIAARMCLHEMEWCRKNQAERRLHSLRTCNREQSAQYQADLREMKERVARAPFLFEQVIQNNIRGTIDRLFTRVLQRQQLDEGLVLKLSALGTTATAGGTDESLHVQLQESPPGDDGRDGELGLVGLEIPQEAGGWDGEPELVGLEIPQEAGGWDGEPAVSGGEDPRPEVSEEEPPPSTPTPEPPPPAETPTHECSNLDCTAGLIPPDC
ncbi:uncharacterized protein LOC144609384 [Rhinoraja longicauda]